MRALCPLHLALILLLTIASMANAQSSEYQKILNQSCAEEEVLHLFESTKDPGLVPVALLKTFLPSASTGDEMPPGGIPQWVAEDFLDNVNAQRIKPTGRCDAIGHGSNECDAADTGVADVLSYQPTVALGSIEYLEDAWSTAQHAVFTLAYIRIDEVFKDPTGQLRPGVLVTYTQPWGSAEIGGVTLCTYPPGGMNASQAAIGQKVVIAGGLDLRNDFHFVTAPELVFRVQGDLILPPAVDSGCFYPTPVAVDEMRELLEK